MIFSLAAKILAYLMCLLGAWLVFAGFMFAGNEDAVAEYLGSRNTGYYIDRGIYMLALGIALGVLTEISGSLAKLTSSSEEE